MGVTIKDVAKKCGLSITTVSLVLNNKESRISEKTKRIITEAAQELSYVPNRFAVGLATKKTLTMGLITFNMKNHYFSTLIQAAEAACSNAGYTFLLENIFCQSSDSVHTIMQTVLSNVDGLIIDPTFCNQKFDQELLNIINDTKIPIISLGPIASQMLPNSIIPDWKRGIYLVTKLLIEQNHKIIGCVFPEFGVNLSSLLIEGYKNALEDNSIDFTSELIIEEAHFEENSSKMFETFLNHGATAVISYSNISAANLYLAATKAGIKIPDQLSLACLEDSPFFSCFEPYISALSLHMDRVARKSIHLIQKLINEEPPLNVSPEMIQPHFFERSSIIRCQ